MGFSLTPNTISSSIAVIVNDTIISTRVTGAFLTTSELVQEYVLSNHGDEASLKIIELEEPWPKLQVQLSRHYEPYKRIIFKPL